VGRPDGLQLELQPSAPDGLSSIHAQEQARASGRVVSGQPPERAGRERPAGGVSRRPSPDDSETTELRERQLGARSTGRIYRRMGLPARRERTAPAGGRRGGPSCDQRRGRDDDRQEATDPHGAPAAHRGLRCAAVAVDLERQGYRGARVGRVAQAHSARHRAGRPSPCRCHDELLGHDRRLRSPAAQHGESQKRSQRLRRAGNGDAGAGEAAGAGTRS
jgi:hypothetical protein